MKKKLMMVLVLGVCGWASADVLWTGNVDLDFFKESNWVDTATSLPPTNAIDPNTNLDPDGSPYILGDAGTNVTNAVSSAGRIDLGNGTVLTVSNSILTATSGSGMQNEGSLNIVDGSTVSLQFINNNITATVDATSTLTLYGGGNPINNGSIINLETNAVINFNNETTNAVISEHLGKIYLDDVPLAGLEEGVNYTLVTDGGAGSVLTALESGIIAVNTNVWDGTAGDGFWTSGNWTINGGSAGSVIAPDTGPSGNLIDYGYFYDTWVINGATINQDVQVKLTGGSLSISNSTVSLLPSSTNTTAALSGLNLGQEGDPTTATVTDSTVTTSRANAGGNSLRVRNGSSLSVVNSDIFVSSETGSGNLTVEATSTLSVDSSSTLNITGGLEVTSAGASVSFDDATMTAGWIRLNSGGEDTTNLMMNFPGGTIDLTDANPLRDDSDFEGAFNWTGDPGDGSITHTAAENVTQTLAYKTTQGFFSVDGVWVNPTNSYDGTNLTLINEELVSLAVNDKYLQITQDSTNTQSIVLQQIFAPIGDVAISGPVTIPGGEGMVLSWDSDDGRSYNVEYKNDLGDAWELYTNFYGSATNIPGTGGSLSVTTKVVEAAEFYQVRSDD